MNAAAELQPMARIIECSEAEYHGDPCERPSLNQSIAKRIVRECPLVGWQFHPKLGKTQLDQDEADRETKATLAGKVIHKLLLGRGPDIAVLDFGDFRTNRAKDARDEAKAAGQLPVLTTHFSEFELTAGIMRDKLEARGIVFDGRSEVAFEFLEDGERGPVVCRARMDHINLDRPLIIDPKTIRSAHPDACAQQIYDFGYDIQFAAYTNCIAKYLDCDPEDVEYLIPFMEIEPPYLITPIDFRKCPDYREIGRKNWSRAVFEWEQALATNLWAEYVPAGETIGVMPRPYVLQKELGSGNW